MPPLPPPPRFFSPLLLIVSASAAALLARAVDIRLERTHLIAGVPEPFVAATCLGILPGECCTAPFPFPFSSPILPAGPSPPPPPPPPPFTTTKVLFRHLLAWDIAAVWGGRGRRDSDPHPTYHHTGGGCSGPPLASRKGPGSWLWRQPPLRTTALHSHAAAAGAAAAAAEGASYIRLPRHLPSPSSPPSDAKTLDYLALQGLLALIWARGSWFASPAAEAVIRSRYYYGGGSGIAPRGHGMARARRDIRSADRGEMFARPPVRVRYPDVVEVDGRVWDARGGEGLFYADADNGQVVNLTTWFLDPGGR